MFNKVVLIGNLGGDPESKTFENGSTVARFSVATSENWKDKDGEWQEKTEWHTVVAWRDLAERAINSLKKGCTVVVEGKISYRNYEDQDGNKKYFTEIVASYFRIVKKNEAAAQEQGNGRTQQRREAKQPAAQEHLAGTSAGEMGTDPDDDLPF